MNGEITEECPPGRIVRGAAVAIVSFVGLGTVSALWDNPLFVHMTPTGASEVALLATLSLLFGVYVGIRRSFYTIGTAAAGGAFGFLGIACPLCNQAVLPLLGSELVLTYFEPVRVYIAVAGVFAVLAAVLQEWMTGEKRGAGPHRGSLALRRRSREILSDYLLTFHRWLARPHAVGMVVPSAAGLTRAMVGAAITGPSGTVVEFGSGTGAITAALLETDVAPANLILVERDAAFHRHLVTRFPGVRTILGDVTDTEALVEAIGDSKVMAIVSGLPLLAMSRGEIRSVLRTVRRLLAEDAAFVQYTYGRGSPFPADLMREFGLEGERLGRVWLNVPPATVWRYRLGRGEAPATAGLPPADAAPGAVAAAAPAE